MEKKSIKKNYIYNLGYQILVLLTPMITTPYLARVLGADGIGDVSFAESVVSYFVLFATLGITTFGQREISYVQSDRKKRTQVFWETKLLELITSILAILVYIPFVFFQDNKTIYLILGFNLLAVMVDIIWLYQGMEEFGKIVFRNTIFKFVGIVYIFCAVKTKSDVNKYVFGLAFFLFLSNASLWFRLPSFVGKPKWKELHPLRSVKTVLSLFIPTIAVQIYTVLDKTMIGLITQSSYENGYYEQAMKISKMVLAVVTALGTVMIPRIGYHFGKGETDKVNYFMYRGYRFVWFLGFPLCFGLIGIASNFVPWFFGDGFDKVVPLLCILSFLIIAIGISNVTGVQYFIPTKRQNLLTITVVMGACVNFCLNMLLIYLFESTGAAIASVTAEITIALVQFYLVRKELSIKKILSSAWHYLLSGLAMLMLLLLLNSFYSPSIVHTAVMTALGALLYFAMLIVLKDDFFIENVKNVVSKIKKSKR